MPNILMIGPSLDALGGMTTVERNILCAVRCRGYDATFVSTFEEGAKAKKAIIAGKAFIECIYAS